MANFDSIGTPEVDDGGNLPLLQEQILLLGRC